VPSDVVTAEVVSDDGGPAGRACRTVLTLVWRAEDPLAVELLLSAQPDHPALPRGRWVVLRDFLYYALEEPTGDGAVRLRPDDGGTRLRLELARPGRDASVCVPQDAVREFLARTEAAVPSGSERSEQAIDALLARLLGTQPPDG